MTGNGTGKTARPPEVWQPNRSGRVLGTRNKFSKQLIEDLKAQWEIEGPNVLRILSKESPGDFARLAYSTLPKDVMLSVEQHVPGNLSPEDWQLLVQLLDTIKAAQVDADPATVFGVIEDALRGHYAKQVEVEGQA